MCKRGMDLDARHGGPGSTPDLEGGFGDGHVSLNLRVVPNSAQICCAEALLS